jgi:membrane dipeptidase
VPQTLFDAIAAAMTPFDRTARELARPRCFCYQASMTLKRRDFLMSVATLAGGALVEASAPQLDRPAALPAPNVDALFERSPIIDALSADENWRDPEPIFEAYKRSGVTVVHTSLANASLAVATRDLQEWQARFDRWPDRLLKIARAGDVAEAKKTGRVGVLLGFQNATIVERNLRNLDALYAAGTRCIQLTYNSRNLLGDGCTERTNAGLSDFGVAVVERMNELGIIVDLSHCGEATSRDGILFSKRPPAFTHTMCKAVYDHVRAKSDELLKALSDKGGVTGIATLGYFIGPTSATSFDDYLRHVDHAVKVAGIDHVALASDYSIRGIEATHTRESWYVPRLTSFKPAYRVRWPPWIKELDPPERFRNIAHGLAKRGYTSEQIEKLLGGNWVRYFAQTIG